MLPGFFWAPFGRYGSVWGGTFTESWGLKMGPEVYPIRYVILKPKCKVFSKKKHEKWVKFT